MKLEFKKHSNLFLVVRKVPLKRNDQAQAYAMICQQKYINEIKRVKFNKYLKHIMYESTFWDIRMYP